MGWGDVVPDRVKDGVESAVEKGGEITSDVGDKVADRLEDAVGLVRAELEENPRYTIGNAASGTTGE